jgi:multiple sugar transport system substrate-binding protein
MPQNLRRPDGQAPGVWEDSLMAAETLALDRRQFLLAVAAAGGAFACPGAARAALGLTPGLAPGKPYAGTELKVLCVVASQFRAHEARLANFTEQTGINVKYTYMPFADMREALAAEMIGGSGDYDLALAMDQWVASLTGLYEPIDNVLSAKRIDKARWPKAHFIHGVVDGATLGVPSRGHVQLLFYRKDLFQKHGLAVPSTWDDVVSTGLELQAKEPGVAGVVVPYGRNNGQNLMVWYNFLWGRGGRLFDEKGAPAFNSSESLASVQDYVDLLRKHKVTPPGAVGFAEQDSVNSMGQGNSAMIPVWWWVRSTLVNPKSSKLTEDQVGFAPMPSYPGKERTTFTNTWIWGVTRNSKHKEAAAELLTWIANPELERDVLLDPKENDVVAVCSSNLVDDAVNARFGGMHRFAAEALAKTQYITYGPDWPQISEALEIAMSEAASGAKSVPDAFNGAASEVQRIIRGG